MWGKPTVKFDPQRHHRQSTRLRGYDYSRDGAYYVTLCTHRRQPLFGDVVAGEMHLTALGRIVHDEWFRSATIRREIALWDREFVVMPNHIHGIVWILDGRGDRPVAPTTNDDARGPGPGSIGAFIAGFKSVATKRINELRDRPRTPVWQRGFHDHIVRDANELQRIRRYISNNPRNWESDEENPQRRR
jgi:REP element-mobilizing transposase RayT